MTTLLSSANDINTYDAAVAEVNRLVVHFFGDSPREKKVRFRVSGVTATDFADRHQNGKCYYKDVDITDFCRKFSYDEWKAICQNNEFPPPRSVPRFEEHFLDRRLAPSEHV